MDQLNLDSPRRKVSVHGLGFVVALSIHWQINFSAASTGGAIQLYELRWHLIAETLK